MTSSTSDDPPSGPRRVLRPTTHFGRPLGPGGLAFIQQPENAVADGSVHPGGMSHAMDRGALMDLPESQEASHSNGAVTTV